MLPLKITSAQTFLLGSVLLGSGPVASVHRGDRHETGMPSRYGTGTLHDRQGDNRDYRTAKAKADEGLHRRQASIKAAYDRE